MAYGARPVPQNIMSVELKIFEVMTLKQFIVTFVMLLVAVFVYFVLGVFNIGPLQLLIPVIFVILGLIVIFVPFNGEPFQEFISSYLEAIISPQIRVWHKKGVIVKSAAAKARFYHFGDEVQVNLLKESQFANQPINETEEQKVLDTEESKFLVSNEINDNVKNAGNSQLAPITTQKYIPPIQKMPQQSNQTMPVSGTSISPKVVQNTANLDRYQQKPAPLQQNDQVQTQQAPQTQNPQTILPQQIQQPTPDQQFLPQSQAPQQPVQINQMPNEVTQSSQEKAQPIYLATEQKASVETQAIEPQPHTVVEEKADEFAPQNYIFGIVEGDNEQNISNAAVIIKKGEENLEVVNSGENGEFQSHYEYKEGTYTLYVNVGSKDFNEISINHDPIDPMPIVIRSRDAKTKTLILDEALPERVVTTANDVFDGSYDATSFSLGTEYLEDEKESMPIAATNEQTSIVRDETVELEQFSLSQNKFEPALKKESELSFYQPISPIADEVFEAESTNFPNISPILHTKETYIDPEPQMFKFEEAVEEAVTQPFFTFQENKANQGEFDSKPFDDIESQPSFASQINASKPNVDFAILRDAIATFDQTFVHIPNTINGIVLNKFSQPTPGVLILVKDQGGNVVRTIASDLQGKFYSYAPFANGQFTVELMKEGLTFNDFDVIFKGQIISPKEIVEIF